MKRSSEDDGGSLDLLLDTICNSFGGVLFISMLVVLLLNMTSREVSMSPPSAVTQAELIEWQQRLAQSDAELDKLRTAFEQQSKIEQLIVDPDALEILRQISDSTIERADMLSEKTESVSDIAKKQAEVNQIAQEVQNLKDAMQQMERNLREAERRLQQEIATRTRTSKLPKLRPTSKTQVVFFVFGGRITSFTAIAPDGSITDNPSEYVQSQDQTGPYVLPKEGAGLKVNPDGSNQDQVRDRLSGFSGSQHYVKVFVWPDSFSEFAVFRDVLVRNGFEYNLNPFPEDGKIYVAASPENPIAQ